MKKARVIALAGAAMMTLTGMAAKFSVDNIEPPHWWTGMADATLQLQVHGADVRAAVPTVDYPGVTIDSVARLDGSPNWQYIYLKISPQAKPGTFTITWKDGRNKVTRKCELRPRTMKSGAQGFSSDDVLYMIMPDRFADGDPSNNDGVGMNFPVKADRSIVNGRHGGDLKGIAEHLDFIDSLGVTAVWLNPVLENDMPEGSYHGYATTNYYRVDPRLGSNADYKALTDSLHARGIKVVMDMIFNHSGSEHPWAKDMPSKDWINNGGEYMQTNHKLMSLSDPYGSDYDRNMTRDGWFVREMPDLNQLNPHLMRYLTQNSIFWVEEVGIDAIRMDTYPYADGKAMARWVSDVEREYPNFTIVGECWFAEPAVEAQWQRGAAIPAEGFDSNLPVVMDFPFMLKSQALKNFTEETTEWAGGLFNLYSHFAMDNIYADPQRLLRFLDNHDTDRFILTEPDSLDSWKQAVTMLLTVPGIPQLYYGTELLMSGDRKPGDGNVRRDVPGGFPGDTHNEFTRAGRSDKQNEAYDFMSRLLQWRKTNEAVRRGTMKHFAPNNGVYVYTRYLKDAVEDIPVVVIMNGTSQPRTIDTSRYEEIITPGSVWEDVLTGETVTPVPEDEAPTLTLRPRAVMVLEPALIMAPAE